MPVAMIWGIVPDDEWNQMWTESALKVRGGYYCSHYYMQGCLWP